MIAKQWSRECDTAEVPARGKRRGMMWWEVRMSDERARFLKEESEELLTARPLKG